MSLVTINEVGEPRSYTVGDGSPMVAYPLAFKGQMMEGTGELSQRPTTPAPVVGAEIDIEVLPPTKVGFPSRLKKVKAPYAGPTGPSVGQTAIAPTGIPQDLFADTRQAAIIRQHSQTAAVYWVATLQKEGVGLPGETASEKFEALRKLFDAFDDDVRQATKPL